MKFQVALWITLTVSNFVPVVCGFYEAHSKIEALLEIERSYFIKLEKYLDAKNEDMRQIKQYYKDIESGLKPFENNINAIQLDEACYLVHPAVHPSSGLEISLRFSKFWDATFKRVFDYEASNELMEMFNATANETTVTDQDLSGTYISIDRLQNIYGLQSKTLAKGIVAGDKAASSMTMDDCRNMGLIQLSREKPPKAIEWFEIAKKKTKDTMIHAHLDQLIMMSQLSIEIDFSRGEDTRSEIIEPEKTGQNGILDDPPEFDDDEPEIGSASTKLFWQGSPHLYNEDDESESEDADQGVEILLQQAASNASVPRKAKYEDEFSELCRIGHKVPISNLVCHLKPSRISYFKWKIEHISDKPPLWIYYDIVTESEVSQLRKIHTEKSYRAATGVGDTKISNHRVGTIYFMTENETGLEDKISRKITDATDMDSEEYAELLQTSHYGLGGHYNPHYDNNPRFNQVILRQKFMGDRRATFMIYLNEVEKGGSTVFINAKIALKPIKYAAAFWINLDPVHGCALPEALHGGCPVLLGSKWVANKWIHSSSSAHPIDYSMDFSSENTF